MSKKRSPSVGWGRASRPRFGTGRPRRPAPARRTPRRLLPAAASLEAGLGVGPREGGPTDALEHGGLVEVANASSVSIPGPSAPSVAVRRSRRSGRGRRRPRRRRCTPGTSDRSRSARWGRGRCRGGGSSLPAPTNSSSISSTWRSYAAKSATRKEATLRAARAKVHAPGANPCRTGEEARVEGRLQDRAGLGRPGELGVDDLIHRRSFARIGFKEIRANEEVRIAAFIVPLKASLINDVHAGPDRLERVGRQGWVAEPIAHIQDSPPTGSHLCQDVVLVFPASRHDRIEPQVAPGGGASRPSARARSRRVR